MATTVKVNNKVWNRIKREIRRADKRDLKVGVLEPAVHPRTNLQIATIAFMHEFGDFDIPERPFILPIVNAFSAKLLEGAARDIIKGHSAIKAYQKMGKVLALAIKDWIENNPYQLSEETIRSKKARGDSFPSQALLETGTLMESISYKVSINDNV